MFHPLRRGYRRIITLLSLIALCLTMVMDPYGIISQTKTPIAEARNIGPGQAESIFNNATTWPGGRYSKQNALFNMLSSLSAIPGNTLDIIKTTPIHQFIDLNGDGLDDLLYYNVTQPTPASSQNVYMAVLLNKGDLTFEVAYKCANIYQAGNPNEWFGDCVTDDRPNENAADWVWVPSTARESFNTPAGGPLPFLNLLQTAGSEVRRMFYTFTDINGDGLVDFLYHSGGLTTTRYNITLEGGAQYFVLLNQGNLNFKIAYRCRTWLWNDTSPYIWRYKGDCAL